MFGRAKELAPESAFEFFVLSEQEMTLPRWICLGKWMAKARVEVKATGSALNKQGSYRAQGALNPLDLELLPVNCNIIAMAPASLLPMCTALAVTMSLTTTKMGVQNQFGYLRICTISLNKTTDYSHKFGKCASHNKEKGLCLCSKQLDLNLFH